LKTFLRACVSAALVAALTAPTAHSATVAKPRLERPIAKVDASGVVTIPLHAPMPASSEGIGPGSHLLMTFKGDGSTYACTANFVWTKTEKIPAQTKKKKKNGKTVLVVTKPATVKKTHYLGAAGHCFLPPDKTSTHGADKDWNPADTSVTVCVSECNFGGQIGFIVTGNHVPLGTVAYTRQTRRGVDGGNDFGIVEIPAELKDQIRPSIPVWEGPSTLEDVAAGSGVCLYGNAGGFGETFPTKARGGVGQGTSEDGRVWAAELPSFQGDSGAALVTCGPDDSGVHGIGAAGILTHIAPGQGAIIGTTMQQAVAMTKRDAGIDLRVMLADGSEVAVPAPPPSKPIAPDEPVHPVPADGSYAWSAGPFTRSAPDEAILLGDACSGTETKSEHCDYEFLQLDVPENGGKLTVTVAATDPENTDFDVFVFAPDGEQLGEGVQAGTPPEVVEVFADVDGVYTVAVDPFTADNASYGAQATFDPAEPPPPPPPADVSLGTDQSWSGDPLLDLNPIGLCGGPADPCVREAFDVDATGAATLVVEIAPDTAGDDFGLCIETPAGDDVCADEIGEVADVAKVTVETGTYSVRVWSGTGGGFGTFTATASLSTEPLPPPPPADPSPI
jgi:hypothetical protein